MSDEQPTSWRERFFGSAPAESRARANDEHAVDQQPAHGAGGAADEADDAAQSVAEHDEHQPLVDHQPVVEHRADDADTAVLDAQEAPAERSGSRRGEHERVDERADTPIEPTVIAPSRLRGPSHSAAHPDDTARTSADEAHREAADSSLERPLAEPDASEARGDAAPPELVEPRRPSFGLRRRSGDADPLADRDAEGEDVDASAGGATAGLAGASAAASTSGRDREFVEPEPTQAMDAQRTDDEATRPLEAQRDDAAQTRVLDAQPEDEQRTQRFGIIRDEVPASSIPVDDETARAAARGGTPIVLVEEPLPPRRKGARAVGTAVALLATLIFAILFAAAFFAVGYLFDRAFDPVQTLQDVWLRPSYLLPVIVFFLAYWIITLIVNRAGWWAHVLGAFLVALLVYAAHIAGAFMEQQGGWAAFTALPTIDAASLAQLLLAPLSVLAFVIAREVPVWVGGIVARRGRKAREWNRQALDDFNAEHAERLAAYERARG